MSVFSSDPDSKYLTVGCQQRFVPATGACLVYKPQQAFLAYLDDPGRISVILKTATPIDSIIPEHFHLPLYMYQTSPLHISPYNLFVKMPRSQNDPILEFFQCGKHPKFKTIFGLSLPNLSSNCTNFCNLVHHYINVKLVEMGGEDLLTRVLTYDAISEVSQYDFDMENLTVHPKHVTLPNN